jgi:hypothetical protein
MSLKPGHKVGDTFSRLLAIPPEYGDGFFVGWVVRSQLRNLAGALVSEATCEWLNPLTTRNLKVRVANTSGWAPGELEIDVRFTRTSDGEVMSTTTARGPVVQDVTQ